MLVREADKDKFSVPEDMKGAKVCSVEGSTSLDTAQDKYGAEPVPLGTYSECVDQLKNEHRRRRDDRRRHPAGLRGRGPR